MFSNIVLIWKLLCCDKWAIIKDYPNLKNAEYIWLKYIQI